MKRKYFRIKNELYFSMLIAVYTMNKYGDFYNNVCILVATHCMKHKYNLKPTIFSEELLKKMIKCCGHSFFEKNENYYYAKCEDFINIFLIFKKYIISSKSSSEILLKIQKNIKKHLEEYLHWDYEEKITLLKTNKEDTYFSVKEFIKEYNKMDKSFTHFMVYYYSSKPEFLEKKKKILVIKKTKINDKGV